LERSDEQENQLWASVILYVGLRLAHCAKHHPRTVCVGYDDVCFHCP
jgi:hypothetical protein